LDFDFFEKNHIQIIPITRNNNTLPPAECTIANIIAMIGIPNSKKNNIRASHLPFHLTIWLSFRHIIRFRNRHSIGWYCFPPAAEAMGEHHCLYVHNPTTPSGCAGKACHPFVKKAILQAVENLTRGCFFL
jgi:hypothetical protein